MLRKLVDYAAVAVFVARGVEVHAQYLSVAETLGDFFFNPFGAIAHNLYGRFLALGADRRYGIFGTAVVALQFVVAAVIGEAHVAKIAFRREGTHGASCHRGISATVVEEDSLLFCRGHGERGVEQAVRQVAAHSPAAPLGLHVYNLDGRQGDAVVTLGQRHQPELAALGLVVCLD